MSDRGERVVLVDAHDRMLGSIAKLDAHRRGLRHRAFSVIVCNERGELLLQQRAPGKYHSGGLWANTCCGHPRAREDPRDAAARRLHEEMGFTCPLHALGTVAYNLAVGEALTENEVTHVYLGRYQGPVRPDPNEVARYRWAPRSELLRTLARDPGSFAPWFRIYLAGSLLPRELLP
jgi:isopentenyl-diphosphate delta-isomerase